MRFSFKKENMLKKMKIGLRYISSRSNTKIPRKSVRIKMSKIWPRYYISISLYLIFDAFLYVIQVVIFVVILAIKDETVLKEEKEISWRKLKGDCFIFLVFKCLSCLEDLDVEGTNYEELLAWVLCNHNQFEPMFTYMLDDMV